MKKFFKIKKTIFFTQKIIFPTSCFKRNFHTSKPSFLKHALDSSFKEKNFKIANMNLNNLKIKSYRKNNLNEIPKINSIQKREIRTGTVVKVSLVVMLLYFISPVIFFVKSSNKFYFH